MTKLFLLLLSGILFSADCERVSLRKIAPFPVGVAIDTEKLKYDEPYWTTALRQFSSFTPEMILKTGLLHPEMDRFNFAEIDHLMDFCHEREIRIHGHTLVWHEHLPDWIYRYRGTREDWLRLLEEHIHKIVSHCAKGVRSWDVVNEAFNDDGSLRNTIWLKKIGPDYITAAFRYARAADSNALLFYNDYSLEFPGPKLEAVLKLMRELRSERLVDGVGLQMHVRLEEPSRQQIRDATKRIMEEKLMIHFSELDVRLNGGGQLFKAGRDLRLRQKQRVKEIVEDYLLLPPSSRFGITLWGVSDGDSWLSADHIRAKPMLFDERYRPKPAFCGFVEGLAQ